MRWSRTRTIILATTGLVAAASASTMLPRAQQAPDVASATPGALSDGSTLLANGWRIAPAGRHVTVGDLPLNAVASPDGRYLVVTNNGLAKPSLSVIDVAAWTVKSTIRLDHAWYGLVWHPDGTRLYSAGAAQNNIQEFSYADGVLTRARTFNLPAQSGDTFAGGLAISRDGRTLYVTRLLAMTVSSIDVASGHVLNTAPLAAEPYSCVLSPDGRRLYISIWGGSAIDVFDAQSLQFLEEYAAGDHPNAVVTSLDGRRLFVACGNSAEVWVIDTFTGEAIEQISVGLFPSAPPTATPNSLALSPDGQKLLVATADANAVAVVDITNSNRSSVDGFIPTGWYPTGAIFSHDGKQIFILSGKGLTPSPSVAISHDRRLLGAVSVVATPDRTTLAEYTRTVYWVTPYNDSIRLTPANVPIGSPIPRTVGASSPIKHVFYIIRENRTYDTVLGDIAQGNGDPKLAIFGKEVTPNAHAIAQQFVLFDNFYVDADVSYNGHAYSTAAYATDFVEKMWQTYYGSRGGVYLSEGGGFMRSPFGNITAPSQGYIWDFAARARVTVRSYGEFVANLAKSATGEVTTAATVPGLQNAIAPSFAGWDLDITDNKRVDAWLQEFNAYVATGHLPQLSIIRLPNDHTAGTRAGAPTPRAMMADNDLAVGRLVEAVSNSAYWKDSAIFIVEDDAQSGPDHVDSHRSVLLVASPFARRGIVDHSFYTTSGVLRTIELILALPPMSQYDAAATPLYAAFDGTPNLSAFGRVESRVPIDERNLPSAYGSTMSLSMDFSDADRAPEVLLNDIVWRSVKGANSPAPPPRRSIFVRASNVDDDDDH